MSAVFARHGAQSSFKACLAPQTSSCALRWQQRRGIVSINSAIHKGLHKDDTRRERGRQNYNRQNADGQERAGRHQAARREGFEAGKPSRRSPNFGDRGPDRGPASRRQRDREDQSMLSPRSRTQANYPLSIPHTTAASQFLYGYSTVYAALRAGRRKCYKLYLHSRGITRDETAVQEKASLRKLARHANVQVIECGEEQLRLLDKMSEGRPHNGIVLEASPLRIPSITNLSISNNESSKTQLSVTHTNGDTYTHTVLTSSASYAPALALLIDDVLDPGNLGAILRTAYFLGVSAVLLTGHVAPLNAVALKSSSGAAEALHMFKLDDPSAVLKRTKENGWNVICATTPTERSGKTRGQLRQFTDQSSSVRYLGHDARISEHVATILDSKPQILVIGGEGRGLRSFLTKEADMYMEVVSPRADVIGDVGLDSLNVSVAAGVVIGEVMRRMRIGRAKSLEAKDGGRDSASSEQQASTVSKEAEVDQHKDEEKMF